MALGVSGGVPHADWHECAKMWVLCLEMLKKIKVSFNKYRHVFAIEYCAKP